MKNFEEDLYKLSDKMKENVEFSTDVYRALCNMRWQDKSYLTNIYSCSWRYAGGLVADIRGGGENYLDFYCSGNEGAVTNEVKKAMGKLGWKQLPWDDEED